MKPMKDTQKKKLINFVTAQKNIWIIKKKLNVKKDKLGNKNNKKYIKLI